ncbi:Uncharacterised protein [Starkeya nomas]|uniref:Uncharacterized protein n=2 Tax=Xanthobacteraceae TaxID=335928 RepID=A0A5S9NCM7_9HYPH|nr:MULTISPECIES: hypothetical protein [Xanthobacteraceae]TSJ62255.1 hypothetical protein FO470_11925 [Ancylobacter moscoviensis]CAA0088022.1 Uncharacterised protein [Starkeya nomas]
MGAVVPFPIRRAQGKTRGVRVPPDMTGEIVILQVVQFVRPEQVPLVPAAKKSRIKVSAPIREPL